MLKFSYFKIIFIPFLFFLLLNKTFALDVRSNIPTFSDPGRVERSLQDLNTQPEKPEPAIQEQEQKPAQLGSEADKIHFKLTNVIFEGNTVYSSDELKKIFASSFNKEISLTHLQNLVDQVTTKYRGDGYILSRAILPPQEIKNGVVKVQVIEGFISNIKIEGNPGLARCLIDGYSRKILRSRPLKLQLLEQQMLIMNDIPGMAVKAVLNPSKDTPGSAELTLLAERKFADAYFAYDNYGTRFIGPLETTLGVGLNSFFVPGDNTNARFTATSKFERMQFEELTHSEPIGCKGTRFLLGTNYTRTNPGFTLEPLDIIGHNFTFFGNLTHPLIRSRTQNLFLRLAGNYQNVTSTLLSLPFYQDRIRSLTFGGFYDLTDHYKGYNTADLSFAHGFEILGAADHVNQSRPKGNSAFSKIDLSLSRLQYLYKRFSLYGSVQGQYAFNALLATEQYGFGGPIYGRGYGPSEIVGDRGAAGKLELRMDTSPSLRLLQTVEYYVFYDAGLIWNLDKVNLPAKQSATSTGIGARLNLIPQLSAEVYLAKPLTRPAFTLTPTDQNGNQARVFFQLVARI